MLIDTNVISELARPAPNPSVTEWLSSERSPSISVITLDEIAFGFASKPHPRAEAAVMRVVNGYFSVLDVTSEVAKLAGQWRGELRRQGVQCTQADALIAATAKVHGLGVATRNVRDFEPLPVHVFNPWASQARPDD